MFRIGYARFRTDQLGTGKGRHQKRANRKTYPCKGPRTCHITLRDQASTGSSSYLHLHNGEHVKQSSFACFSLSLFLSLSLSLSLSFSLFLFLSFSLSLRQHLHHTFRD